MAEFDESIERDLPDLVPQDDAPRPSRAPGFDAVTSHYFRKTVATLMDEAGLAVRSATDQRGPAKPSLTADIYMGRKKGLIGPAAVLEARPTLIGSALGPMPRGPLGTDLAPGFLALVGLLLQPSLNGLPTVPHMTAHPIADRTVALVPPAIQGVNGDAQHFRDIRERHQLVTGLECHDHLLSRGSHFDVGSLGPPSQRGDRCSRRGRSGKWLGEAARPVEDLSTVNDLSREAAAGGR
jgi:hypothetical protein